MRNAFYMVYTIIRWFLDPSTAPYGSAQDDIIDVMLRMTYILNAECSMRNA